MIRTASPGPGNGWRQTISSGRPSSSPTRRTSSLKRFRSGSTSVELHVLRQAADVVVTLDLRGVLRAGLDHVGIEGALHQEAGIFELVASDLFEDPDERLADDLALASPDR